MTLKVRPRWATERPIIPKKAPEGSCFNTGFCAASVDDWLAKRATEEQRQTVDKLFNEQIGLKLEIPRQQVRTPAKASSTQGPPQRPVTSQSSRSKSRVATPKSNSRPSTSASQRPINSRSRDANNFRKQGIGGMAPGMQPEGFMDGPSTDEIVDIKPYRNFKERVLHGREKPKKIITDVPRFNPTRELTSYEAHFSGSELMPAMYEQVKVLSQPRRHAMDPFRSQYGEDLKKAGDAVWRKNLTTQYRDSNLALQTSDTSKALAKSKADVFYRSMRQSQLYYGALMDKPGADKVDDWIKKATNEEREGALDMIRTMYCVVDPMSSGAVGPGEGSHMHEAYRGKRPNSADRFQRTAEYICNKEACEGRHDLAENIRMQRRMKQVHHKMVETSREKKRTDTEQAEQRAQQMIDAKNALLREFMPAHFRDRPPTPEGKENQVQKLKDNIDADAEGVYVTGAPPLGPTSQQKFQPHNVSQIPMGAGGSDPNANKSAYMMSYSVNVPAIMIAHKQKALAKTDEGIKPWNQTTAPYGAVNYLGYEKTSQPAEFQVPRHLTVGLKPETFNRAFLPMPSMPSVRPPTSHARSLRPSSSAATTRVGAGAAKMDHSWRNSARQAKRATASARNGQQGEANIPLGVKGMQVKQTWGTTYGETHTGRQSHGIVGRPITAPVGSTRGSSRGSNQEASGY